MIFDRIDEWPQNEPVVEVPSEGRLIDLHNWASFLGFEYRLPETLLVLFDYDESEGGMRQGRSKEVRLRFKGVTDLRVGREQLENTYEANSLSDFIYRELRPGIGGFRAGQLAAGIRPNSRRLATETIPITDAFIWRNDDDCPDHETRGTLLGQGDASTRW